MQLSLDAKSRQNLQGLYIDKLTRDTQTTNAGFKKIQTILTVCIFGFKSLCFLILFHLIPLKQYCSNRYTKLVCHIILIDLIAYYVMSMCTDECKKDNVFYVSNTAPLVFNDYVCGGHICKSF